MHPYEVILHERAWAALATTKGAARRRLLALLDDVKTGPFRSGDFQQRDASGRRNACDVPGTKLAELPPDSHRPPVHGRLAHVGALPDARALADSTIPGAAPRPMGATNAFVSS